MLCAALTSLSLFALSAATSRHRLLVDAAASVLLVFVAIYIFVWSNCFSKEVSKRCRRA